MKQKEIKVIFEKTGETYFFELMSIEIFMEEVEKAFTLQKGTYSIISFEKKLEIRNTEELRWYGQSQGVLISQCNERRCYSPVPHLNLSQIQNKKQYSIIKKTQEIKTRLNQTIKNLKETNNTVTCRSLSPEENWKKLQEKTQILQEQAQRFANKREELQCYSDNLLKEILVIQNENVKYSKRNDGLMQSISQVQMMLNLQKKQINNLKTKYPAYDLDKFVNQIKTYKHFQQELMNYLQEFDNILHNQDLNDSQNGQYQLLQLMKEFKKMQ